MTRIVFFSLCTICFFTLKAQQPAAVSIQAASPAFEENKGQIWDMNNQPAPYVQYHYQNAGMHVFMLATGIAYQFTQVHYPEGYEHDYRRLSSAEIEMQEALRKDVRLETYRMDMELVGANPQAKIIAEGKSKDYVNYYNRNTLDVHSFEKLIYQDIYPGIDWVIYTTENGLKYDFMVSPGANPNLIQLKFKDHEAIQLNKDGSFTLSNRMGAITEKAPISFQGQKEVETHFQLQENTIQFQVDSYHPQETLIIDPNLVWATYYGGSGAEFGRICRIDKQGNVYFTGTTSSLNNIAVTGHQNTFGGGTYDAFLVKFDSSGTREWATYYGGTDIDSGTDIVIDIFDYVYLSGYTKSTSNIAFNGYQNSYGGGTDDVFLVKFDSVGTRQWATYYGGSNRDVGGYCEADWTGNIYLSGNTRSTNNIAFNGHQNFNGGGDSDAFLVKFDSSGARQWATYYGGADDDVGGGLAIDLLNNVYMGGGTESTTNIAFNGHQNTYGGGFADAFLVKFDSSGTREWATYYGGTLRDYTLQCVADDSSHIYLLGWTNSTNNIAFNGHQNTYGGGNTDALLVKFDSSGIRQWATYYGGNQNDYFYDGLIDEQGHLYLTGHTASSSNIAFNGYQNTYGGDDDAYILKINKNGGRIWASYYGDNGEDLGRSCTKDLSGNIYLSGTTRSTSGIASNGHQNSHGGGNLDGFLVKFKDLSCSNTFAQLSEVACDSFIFNNQTYYNTGVYTDTLTAVNGCDSILTLNLTINNSTSGTDVQTVCVSYTWIDGNTYTSSNNSATFTIVGGAAHGCDSVVSLNLTINNVDNTVSLSGDTLTANQAGATYQWLDCDNGNAPIAGATSQDFTPGSSGNYAVEVTANGCMATSSCQQVILSSLTVAQMGWRIYPNPANDQLFVELEQPFGLHIRLVDLHGRQVWAEQFTNQELIPVNLTDYPAGVYILQMEVAGQWYYQKIVKQ